MDITNIATPDYVEVRADKRLGKIRSIFDRERPNGIIVTKQGGYTGVVGEKQLVRSRMGDDTKVDVVTKSAPKLDRHEDVREAARMLVEGDVNVAPVFEGEQLYGIVTGEAILEAVLENLDAISVDDIFTDDVVDVAEQSPLGEAINKLREHSISRVPVVEEDGSNSLTGILTTHDIIDFVVRDDDRQGRGDRSGDVDRMLDLPVYDLMSAPVITAQPDEQVSDAVERMFDNDISGLVVTPATGDTTIEGVLTKTDVLRALTFTEEESMDVQITNIGLLETLTRAEIVESITDVVDKYQQMQVLHAHVRLHEHKEKLRGTPLMQCQIRLRTSLGQVAGSGEGYGAENAFYVALDKLERNVLEMKGINADERYRGQLIRKLGEL
jgi:CBS domain-containing protein